jgi:hypothetical protein
MVPGLGFCGGLSTSFWKIQGWLERQAFFRRMAGLGGFIGPL